MPGKRPPLDLVYMTQQDVYDYAHDRYWEGFRAGFLLAAAAAAIALLASRKA